MISEGTFQALETDVARQGGGYVYRRMLPQSPYDVRLEVAAQSGKRRLCVKVAFVPALRARMKTRAFSTEYVDAEGVFRVELQDARFGSLFAALLDNFMTALEEARAGEDPAQVLLDRLLLWQRLFEELSVDGLSPESQRGLFAELVCLRDVLIPALGPIGGVMAWKAPDRTSKDFAHGKVAIEVKSRMKKSQLKIRVSSENQLDLVGFDLYLMVVTLDAESQGGATLPQIVKQLREGVFASGSAMIQLDDRLVRAGYMDIHDSHYGDATYTMAMSHFHVRESFPRLTPNDLPQGVSHVAYDVDLAVLAPFAIGTEVLHQSLRGSVDV
ncbi:MAG: PD-(D/E)XK motif protein [Verrucomicrobiaceae bacterium]|nr:MAG: PD-(D/E)XK motif protein [Verrucomicrobiaceae bacterium]